MHKQTILKMCKVAGVEYAKSGDPDAPDWLIWLDWPCEESTPAWLPDWVSGVPPEELYEWMLEQSATVPAIHDAMVDGGMRPRSLKMEVAKIRRDKFNASN